MKKYTFLKQDDQMIVESRTQKKSISLYQYNNYRVAKFAVTVWRKKERFAWGVFDANGERIFQSSMRGNCKNFIDRLGSRNFHDLTSDEKQKLIEVSSEKQQPDKDQGDIS